MGTVVLNGWVSPDEAKRLTTEIEQLKETIRAFGRGDIVPITDKDAEIQRLTAALANISSKLRRWSGHDEASMLMDDFADEIDKALGLEQKADPMKHPRAAKVLALAAPFGLADAPWDYFDTRPTPDQCVVIVGQYDHGQPVIEAAQYDGINFFGWLGGRHNQETWAWLDAKTAGKLATTDIPNLLKQYRPRHL